MHTYIEKNQDHEVCPALTVSQIVYIAYKLDISYIEALSFINRCRRSGKGVQFCLQQLVYNYQN